VSVEDDESYEYLGNLTQLSKPVPKKTRRSISLSLPFTIFMRKFFEIKEISPRDFDSYRSVTTARIFKGSFLVMKVLVFLKTLLTVYRLGCRTPDGWNPHVVNRCHIFGVKEDDSKYSGRG